MHSGDQETSEQPLRTTQTEYIIRLIGFIYFTLSAGQYAKSTIVLRGHLSDFVERKLDSRSIILTLYREILAEYQSEIDDNLCPSVTFYLELKYFSLG